MIPRLLQTLADQLDYKAPVALSRILTGGVSKRCNPQPAEAVDEGPRAKHTLVVKLSLQL